MRNFDIVSETQPSKTLGFSNQSGKKKNKTEDLTFAMIPKKIYISMYLNIAKI